MNNCWHCPCRCHVWVDIGVREVHLISHWWYHNFWPCSPHIYTQYEICRMPISIVSNREEADASCIYHVCGNHCLSTEISLNILMLRKYMVGYFNPLNCDIQILYTMDFRPAMAFPYCVCLFFSKPFCCIQLSLFLIFLEADIIFKLETI